MMRILKNFIKRRIIIRSVRQRKVINLSNIKPKNIVVLKKH